MLYIGNIGYLIRVQQHQLLPAIILRTHRSDDPLLLLSGTFYHTKNRDYLTILHSFFFFIKTIFTLYLEENLPAGDFHNDSGKTIVRNIITHQGNYSK